MMTSHSVAKRNLGMMVLHPVVKRNQGMMTSHFLISIIELSYHLGTLCSSFSFNPYFKCNCGLRFKEKKKEGCREKDEEGLGL